MQKEEKSLALEAIVRMPLTYNASAVKINNATSSLVRFENKYILFCLGQTL
jgi:hypothetical protein